MISAPPKSFWLGVATAFSAVWVAQNISSFRSRRKGKGRKSAIKNQSRPNTTSPPDNNVKQQDKKEILDTPELDQRMIRKAESVIRWRTSRITVVVERCTDDHNYSAILRTAEALGIQNIWLIDPPPPPTVIETGDNEYTTTVQKSNAGLTASVTMTEQELKQRAMHHLFAQKANEWLTVREFPNTTVCIEEMRNTGHDIWVTDLSQYAVTLTPEGLSEEDDFYKEFIAGSEPFCLPPKVAIVMGTEAVGCSEELLKAADKRVYLPLRGFADSLNLSVATALVLHQLFLLDPSVIGGMSEDERRELRLKWFTQLCKQRLLSSGQKKYRAKLKAHIHRCEKIQAKKDNNERLQKGEIEKLAQYENYKKELEDLERKNHLHENDENGAITKAIQDLVDCPPSPLTDLRRADTHRVTYVGKNTKQKHEKHWGNMAATTSYNTQLQKGVSSDFFRARVEKASGGRSGN